MGQPSTRSLPSPLTRLSLHPPDDSSPLCEVDCDCDLPTAEKRTERKSSCETYELWFRPHSLDLFRPRALLIRRLCLENVHFGRHQCGFRHSVTGVSSFLFKKKLKWIDFSQLIGLTLKRGTCRRCAGLCRDDKGWGPTMSHGTILCASLSRLSIIFRVFRSIVRRKTFSISIVCIDR